MLDEKLSALIDDELDRDELNDCLEQISRSPELRQAWSRQHFLRAALNGQAMHMKVDLADSVMAAIELETAGAASASPVSNKKVLDFPLPKWRSGVWAGGLALAASVAVIAVMLPVVFNGGESQFATESIAMGGMANTQPVAQRQRVQANDEARRELQQYLLDHEALASGHGLSGQRRYMRMASPSTTYVAYSPE